MSSGTVVGTFLTNNLFQLKFYLQAMARGSIPGQNGVFIELHVLRKGQ